MVSITYTWAGVLACGRMLSALREQPALSFNGIIHRRDRTGIDSSPLPQRRGGGSLFGLNAEPTTKNFLSVDDDS